jgi:hypothetical protein
LLSANDELAEIRAELQQFLTVLKPSRKAAGALLTHGQTGKFSHAVGRLDAHIFCDDVDPVDGRMSFVFDLETRIADIDGRFDMIVGLGDLDQPSQPMA